MTVDMLHQLREKRKLFGNAMRERIPTIGGRTLDRYKQHQDMRAVSCLILMRILFILISSDCPIKLKNIWKS